MIRGRTLTSVWCILLITGLLSSPLLRGQDVPSKPLSIPVFTPMLINPAYVGSKDFTNISLTTKALKYPDSQVLNLHKRLSGPDGGYSNLGFGAFVFQEQLEESWNTGMAASGSYHYAIDDKHLHNIAAGATLKGIFTIPKKENESVADSFTTVFRPNLDFGIYYYGPQAFGGLSATSIFDTKTEDDSTTASYSQIDREFHLYGGYKIVLSKNLGIVLEPSLLVSLNDETLSEPHKHLVPYLKVYLQNFYLGSYLKDFDTFALFFQYQFPRFYTGVFLEFPRIGFLNDDNIIFEVSLGINLGEAGATFLKYRHW